MSPDERRFGDLLARAARRRKALFIGETVGWAGGGAASAALITTALGFGMASRVAAVAGVALGVAVSVGAMRRRELTAGAITGALERAHPESRNLIVTAAELSSGALSAKGTARDRVYGDVVSLSPRIDLATAFPIRPLVRAAAVAAAAWIVVAAGLAWRGPLARLAPAALGRIGSTVARTSEAAVHVTVTKHPPAYTGLLATTAVDPAQTDALQGTVIALVVDTSAERVTAEHDGVVHALTRDSSLRFNGRFDLTKTGYVAIDTSGGGRRVIPVVVSPDALPAVRVTAPGRDLVYPDAAQRVAFDVRATDDFGLRSLSLHYTKVTGSGEQFEFQEGEIPLAISKTNGRDWRGTAARSMADLALKDGDVLVYRAVAADARPGDGAASSDAFFIEISKLGVAAGDAFTLPEEETRYALSQQMLIIKTERLHARRAAMSAADVSEAALNLAVEQRMIRAEFVFMLGGEVEDEEVEAQQSTELQEGRLQNRGQRDLRAATVAMSQAEKLLTGADTAAALTAERTAVTALQRAFARDRYILRALATQTQLEPDRRLTGNVSQAVSWRREIPGASVNRRAALLQDALAGIGVLRASTTDGSRRAVALAREVVLIDPESAALRMAAADLQRTADTWSSTPTDARQRSIDAIGASIAAEAVRTLAGPTLFAPSSAAPLSGAFVDALRRGGSR